MIRNIRLQVIVVVAGLVLIGALLIWQASGLFSVFVPAQGGTYIEGLVGAPQTLNPLLSQYNPVDRDLSALLFDGLTRLDEHGDYEARLAREWSVSEDGRVYTFSLRPNIRWSDGRPLTSDDVVFTINLLRDPGYDGPADVAALWRSVTITRVNALELQFALPEPYAPFLDYTTIGILPQHILNGVTADGMIAHPFNLNPVGSGPMMLDPQEGIEVREGRIYSIAFVPNAMHWDENSHFMYLSKVRFRFYPDEAAVLTAYEAGDVQGISRVIVQIILSLAVIVLVLIQMRNAGLGGVFGGDSQVQYTKRGVDQMMFNATIGVSVAFFIVSLLNVLYGG